MIYYMVHTIWQQSERLPLKKTTWSQRRPAIHEARKLLEGNGGWGNVREAGSKAEAVESNNLFINEVMGQCLSIGRV